MKKSFFLHLQIVVLVLVIFGCSDKVVQEPIYTPPPSSPGTTVPPSSMDNLKVDAGIDQLVFLPLTETQFMSYAVDYFKKLTDLKYEWKKLKGPDRYKMDDSTKVSPILSNLEMGLYEFAFNATTPDARFASDTINIQVVQPLGEFVIQKLSWNNSVPMGGGGELQIPVRINKDKPVRIYIKPEGLVINWIEVEKVFSTTPPYPLFNFIMHDDTISIYTAIDENSLGGYWELKIVF